MKLNPKNSMIFIFILLLVLFGIGLNNKFNLGKNVYVVSPENDIEKEKINHKKDANSKKIDVEDNEEIVVYISGEVKMPGVVNINKKDRLINAIEKLGGLTQNADLNRVNLAIKLDDGCHYIIPKIGENTQDIQCMTNNTQMNENNNVESISSNENYQNNSNNDNNKNSNGKININNASLEQLNGLPGIGDILAKRIMDYKNKNGKFKSVEDLNNVPGIGEKKFDGLKDCITVN